MFKPKNNKGFTIIELIVVIAIIVVLSTIVISGVTAYKRKAQMSAVLADTKAMAIMATDFYNNHGTFSGFCNDGTRPGTVNPQLDVINDFVVTIGLGSRTFCQDKAIFYDGSLGTSSPKTTCTADGWIYYGYLMTSRAWSSVFYSVCADNTGLIVTRKGTHYILSDFCNCAAFQSSP